MGPDLLQVHAIQARVSHVAHARTCTVALVCFWPSLRSRRLSTSELSPHRAIRGSHHRSRYPSGVSAMLAYRSFGAAAKVVGW